MFSQTFELKETRMRLRCDLEAGLEKARTAVSGSRLLLENYILAHPDFRFALDIREVDLQAPAFVREMMLAGLKAGVGPMASVAGGLSEVATDAMLTAGCKAAVAENGGDISIKGERETVVGVYAGDGKAERVGFRVKPDDFPVGICTSAGTLGHSISMGDADAVVVFSPSAFLSDAAATAVANLIKSNDVEGSIQLGLERAEDIEGVEGCMIFAGGLVGRTGSLPEMVEVVDFDL